MVRCDVLPDSPIFLKKGEAEAGSQNREDENTTEIEVALLIRSGRDHRYLVEFVHLVRMVVPGSARVGVRDNARSKKKSYSKGAAEAGC